MEYQELYSVSEDESDVLAHYGTKFHSGRYPWGSGDDPYQHSGDFLARIETLKKSGLSETDIAKSLSLDLGREINTTELRAYASVARTERYNSQLARINNLKSKGYNRSQIAEEMGINESTVRSLENEDQQARRNAAINASEFLKNEVTRTGSLDIGKGTAQKLGISEEKLNQAMYILTAEGYTVEGMGLPQPGRPGQNTTLRLLIDKGESIKSLDLYNNYDKIGTLNDKITYDDGETFHKAFEYPESLNSKRLMVRYADDVGPDGAKGIEKDGLIEIRRGCDDLSLGKAQFSQVRIMVDGTHYLKGMCVYSDDLPDGVDVVFNTNKSKDTPALGPKNNTVLKNIKEDPDNPFGSNIKEHGGQYYYTDKDGNQKLGLINKRAEEGDWSDWSNKIPSQFLSKQPLELAKKQLKLAETDKEDQLKEIMEYSNPTIRKRLLDAYASECDSAAEHLYAAALPRQQHHVILPMNTLSDTQVYAPNYDDGEKVALIRYPHAGRFEIPILTVTRKNEQGQQMIGTNAIDAIGINHKVAARLSGADFDGDSVMVIPINSKSKIVNREPLKGLKDFDPQVAYAYHDGISVMKESNKGKQMGVISNLITDMTLGGATDDEMARAVRHSMVVIDAPKHRLDYKRSELENGIAELKQKYQGHIGEDGRYHEGAATIISRAKSEVSVFKTKGSRQIDPETGKEWYKITDQPYYQQRRTKDDPNGKYKKGDLVFNKDGTPKMVKNTKASTKMREADDAYTLVGDLSNPMERLYADYANKMKSLANSARKEMVTTPNLKYDPSAAKTYAKEVKDLGSKLKIAESNAPKEREAAMIANSIVAAKTKGNKDITKAEKEKMAAKEMPKARAIVGSKRQMINITEKEWKAIESGAISENTLQKILKNADLDQIKQYATPRKSSSGLRSSQVSKIQAMKNSGYTNAEIAEAIGVSVSTIQKYSKGGS